VHRFCIIPEKSELKSEAFWQSSNKISDVETHKSVDKSAYEKKKKKNWLTVIMNPIGC
jgi:hypothetical protein